MSAPAPAPDRARQLRRRHRHERQAVVFGVLLAVLAVAGLGSAAVYTGALSMSFLDRPFSTPSAAPTEAAAAVACPPQGALPVPYGQIQVNVYNGTGRAGLAAATAAELAGRGFAVASTGNSDSYAGTARVTAGASGVAAAYTLAAQVQDAVVVLDARADATVDLALGGAFGALVDPAAITLVADQPLVGPEGCVPLEEVLAGAAPTTPPAG
ncbi:LytR C-terminal domain-containing protein [Cellulomonas endophytica]|uniref:LytR C-terminal domain-containing protein n=1 Tax=Cellulomonas endophytica TaxID=2494735 RepID=UPI0010102156|nr:LytR C-terminal domain-containing protein [Cellulomonas endophytica]